MGAIREDFEKLLSRVAFEQEFANTAGKTCQLDDGEPVDVTSTARNALAKSLLYHLRNLEADAIDGQFDGVRDDSSRSSENNGCYPTTLMLRLTSTNGVLRRCGH